jgi:hypothetical protein
MPSPFPGMDPFLEHPRYFPDLQGSFITHLRENIQAKLPAPYFAVIGERLLVEASERHIEPDVDVLTKADRQRRGHKRYEDNGHIAVLPATRTEPVYIKIPHDDIRETYCEIRIPDEDDERIVTTVELLSRTNKGQNSAGREKYLAKQTEILNDERINLIEIDLLRDGKPTTVVDQMTQGQFAAGHDYHVSIHLYYRTDCLAYPFRLQDSLPEIVVPLLARDGGITVDLQTVFEQCYDLGPYQRRVRYEPARLTGKPTAKQRAWIISRLKGLKKAK